MSSPAGKELLAQAQLRKAFVHDADSASFMLASTKTTGHMRPGKVIASRTSNAMKPAPVDEYDEYLEAQAQHSNPDVRRRAEAVIAKRAKAATR